MAFCPFRWSPPGTEWTRFPARSGKVSSKSKSIEVHGENKAKHSDMLAHASRCAYTDGRAGVQTQRRSAQSVRGGMALPILRRQRTSARLARATGVAVRPRPVLGAMVRRADRWLALMLVGSDLLKPT